MEAMGMHRTRAKGSSVREKIKKQKKMRRENQIGKLGESGYE